MTDTTITASASEIFDVITHLPRHNQTGADLVKAKLSEGLQNLDLSRAHQERIRITKDKVRRVLACEANFDAVARQVDAPTPAMVAGTLLDTLFSQVVSGTSIERPLDDAIAGLTAAGEDRSIEAFQDLNEEARQKTIDRVIEVAALMQENWPIDEALQRLQIRLQDRISMDFNHHRVELHGRPDLIFSHSMESAPQTEPHGTPEHSVAIIDAKSGSQRQSDVEDAVFYAVLETIRSNALPTLTGNYYLATDSLILFQPTLDLLLAEVDRITAAVTKIVLLASGAPLSRHLCDYCEYCPIRSTCPEFAASTATLAMGTSNKDAGESVV